MDELDEDTEQNVNEPVDRQVQLYLEEITIYEREAGPWENRARKINQRYKNEQSAKTPKKRLNLFWANVQTMLPSLYMREPKADISKRFNSLGTSGRTAALVLEKCTNYFIQKSGFNSAMEKAVRGLLLPGRGTVWTRYVPHMRPAGDEVDDTKQEGDEITDEARQEPLEEVFYEALEVDFVHFDDLGHNICRSWDEVYVVWRRVFLDRDELVQRFGDKGKKVPLDYKAKSSKGSDLASAVNKATVYEGWDKKRKVAFWLHKDMPELLDEKDDPLKLEGFFPTPEPLLANLAEDSLIPTPDFTLWQEQANQIDELTARIASLTRALKVVGVYDSSAQGLDRLLSEGNENKLIAVDQWAMFAEKGGMNGVIQFFPVEVVAKTLVQAFEARDKVKAEAYEVTGMADILRGATDPEETYGAQRIKSQYANLRLAYRQKRVHNYARDVVNIMAEIIANHFSVKCLKDISDLDLFDTDAQKQMAQQQIAAQQQPPQPQPQQPGQPPAPPPGPPPPIPEDLQEKLLRPSWEEVERLLRDAPARSFKLDIETKSTINVDEAEEKGDRVELIKAVGGFMGQVDSVADKSPELVPLLCRLLMFGVRAFPVGKELEEAFQVAIAKLEKKAANPQPKPDPAQIKAQAQIQIEQAKTAAAQQAEQARVQADAQIEQQRMQQEMQMEQMRLHFQQQAEQAKQQWQQWQVEQQNKVEMIAQQHEMQMQMMANRVKEEMAAQTKIIVAHISAASAIEVARIAADASLGVAEEAREAAGERANGPN